VHPSLLLYMFVFWHYHLEIAARLAFNPVRTRCQERDLDAGAETPVSKLEVCFVSGHCAATHLKLFRSLCWLQVLRPFHDDSVAMQVAVDHLIDIGFLARRDVIRAGGIHRTGSVALSRLDRGSNLFSKEQRQCVSWSVERRHYQAWSRPTLACCLQQPQSIPVLGSGSL